jgi:hypothetical protein
MCRAQTPKGDFPMTPTMQILRAQKVNCSLQQFGKSGVSLALSAQAWLSLT